MSKLSGNFTGERFKQNIPLSIPTNTIPVEHMQTLTNKQSIK